jgi:hypothetical protein
VTFFVILLVLNTVAILFWAWTVGLALIRIEDHREAEQTDEPILPPLPPSRHVPDVERHIEWVLPPDAVFEAHLAALGAEYAATIRAFRWATGELERILIDVRDEVHA